MKSEEKLELIYICSHSIAWIKSNLENFPGDREEMLKDLRIKEIALASLTAQPVKLPERYDISSMIDVEKDDNGPLYLRDEVIASIRAAGYEVEE